MSENENPESTALPIEAAEAKPARKRAPRKTAAAASAAPETATDVAAEEQAPVAAKPARKTRAKKVQADAPEGAVADAVASTATDTTTAPAEPAQSAEAVVALAEAPAEQDSAAQDAPDAANEADAQASERPPRGQGKERGTRPALPNRGKQIPVSDEPVAVLAFDDIIAGALDGEDAPDAPGFPKRVLPPQPELPKLHKVLAQAGLGSRLEMERLIADGGISVNNQAAHVGQRIQWGDKVRVNGKLLRLNIAPPMPRVLAYHKPAGEVVTHDDPQNRPTVFRRLPRLQQGKWQSVGRLDLNTEGLLLLTSSGELANGMMHPSFGLEREYAARVLGALSAEEKQQLLDGIALEDGPAQFSSISDGGGEGANQWYKVTIHEGRNREVRRMFETLGHAVSRLIRIRYGVVQLPRGLRRGFYMELGEREVKALMEAAGMDTRERQGPMTRIDPKREQARSRGLRRAQPQFKDLPPDGGQAWGEAPEGDYPDAQEQARTDYAPGQGGDANEQPRLRRTPFGRKRGSNTGPRQGGGQNPQGREQTRDFPRPTRDSRDARPSRPERQERQPRGYDADDEFSQRGVSHESPFEAKASRKKIFSSGTQVPDIIKAQRGAASRGGQRSGGGGGQGGIDPMRTSLGFIGGDSYRGGGGNNGGNRRGGGGGSGGRNSGFGGQRSGGGGGGFGGQRSGGGGGGGGRGRGR